MSKLGEMRNPRKLIKVALSSEPKVNPASVLVYLLAAAKRAVKISTALLRFCFDTYQRGPTPTPKPTPPGPTPIPTLGPLS